MESARMPGKGDLKANRPLSPRKISRLARDGRAADQNSRVSK
jgi:hypothetical protein